MNTGFKYNMLIINSLVYARRDNNDLLNNSFQSADADFYETLDVSRWRRIVLFFISCNFILSKLSFRSKAISAMLYNDLGGIKPFFFVMSAVMHVKETLSTFFNFHIDDSDTLKKYITV